MKILEYFTSDNQPHWLEEIRGSDWGAGQFLYELLRDGKLKATVGQTALVPMLVEEETGKLVSFCTFAPLDDIQPTELTPWVGFVYTFPEYRGHRMPAAFWNTRRVWPPLWERKPFTFPPGIRDCMKNTDTPSSK